VLVDFYLAATQNTYPGDWRTAYTNVCEHELAGFVGDPSVPSLVSNGGLIAHPWAGVTGDSMANQLDTLNVNNLFALNDVLLYSATDWVNSDGSLLGCTTVTGATDDYLIAIGQTDPNTVFDNCLDWSNNNNAPGPSFNYGTFADLFYSTIPVCVQPARVLCLIEQPSNSVSPIPAASVSPLPSVTPFPTNQVCARL
jgi:hypothetical protein